MTLTEITTEVRNITGVDATSVVSDAVIHDLINEAQYQLCDEANLLQGYATRNSVVDTREYAMKNSNVDVTDWTLFQNNTTGAITSGQSLESMTRIYRVDYDGSICQRIGINEINDIADDSSMSNITTDKAFYIHEDKLGIFPTPTEVKEIKVYYYRLPHKMLIEAVTASASTTSNMTSTADLSIGMKMSGSKFSVGTVVSSITSATQFTTNISSGSGGADTVAFSEFEIDDRYQRILIYYPCWRVSERLRDLNLISYFKNEWLEQKQRVILERQSRDGSTILTVPYNDF
jgi:hypothetical protein